MRRVAITGLGAVTPYGLGHEKLWQGITNGQSGIHEVPKFIEDTRFPTHIGGVVPEFPVEDFVEPREIKKADRYVHLAITAATLAWRDSGLDSLTDEETNRTGVAIANVIGGLSFIDTAFETVNKRGHRRVTPFLIPGCIPNMVVGAVSIALGLRGPQTHQGTACAAGNMAIGDGLQMIRYGKADRIVAGGAEACLVHAAMAGFSNMRALASGKDGAETASKPFDRRRDGFVMSEGAGILVLEEMERAKQRGATIYAEVTGLGLSGDGYHITTPVPGGEGAARCMRAALQDAGLAPEDIDYVNAHGTATGPNDLMETQAIRAAFGAHADKLWVSSTKSFIGHAMGAAGGIEGVVCALALHHGLAHQTLNYEEPDPECDLDYIAEGPREKPLRAVMNNGFGFGGGNASVVFLRVDG